MIKRNPALVVVFSIITCGIYTFYWIYQITRDVETELVNRDNRCGDPAMAVLFTIITCGFYGFYWWYCEGKRIAQLQYERGIQPSDNSVVYLILCIFGLSIVSMIIMQSDMNRIADTPRPGGDYPGGGVPPTGGYPGGNVPPTGGYYPPNNGYYPPNGGTPPNAGAGQNGYTDPNGYYAGTGDPNGYYAGSPTGTVVGQNGADIPPADPYNGNPFPGDNNQNNGGFNR